MRNSDLAVPGTAASFIGLLSVEIRGLFEMPYASRHFYCRFAGPYLPEMTDDREVEETTSS